MPEVTRGVTRSQPPCSYADLDRAVEHSNRATGIVRWRFANRQALVSVGLLIKLKKLPAHEMVGWIGIEQRRIFACHDW